MRALFLIVACLSIAVPAIGQGRKACAFPEDCLVIGRTQTFFVNGDDMDTVDDVCAQITDVADPTGLANCNAGTNMRSAPTLIGFTSLGTLTIHDLSCVHEADKAVSGSNTMEIKWTQDNGATNTETGIDVILAFAAGAGVTQVSTVDALPQTFAVPAGATALMLNLTVNTLGAVTSDQAAVCTVVFSTP
jgi:hypothetical protein